MLETISHTCWICGSPATTREHLVKKSDLLGIFGTPSPGKPLFLHNQKKTNYFVQGLNSNALKLESKICSSCNNSGTQPYDRAWEIFSNYLRNRKLKLAPEAYVRANRAFPYNTQRHLRDVQLYFVKLFGCLIHENGITIELGTFSKALTNRTFHPNIFLKLGYFNELDKTVGVAGLSTISENKSKKVVLAHWFYELGDFAVNIIYALDTQSWESTKGAWLPQHGTSRMKIHDFSKDLTRQ